MLGCLAAPSERCTLRRERRSSSRKPQCVGAGTSSPRGAQLYRHFVCRAVMGSLSLGEAKGEARPARPNRTRGIYNLSDSLAPPGPARPLSLRRAVICQARPLHLPLAARQGRGRQALRAPRSAHARRTATTYYLCLKRRRASVPLRALLEVLVRGAGPAMHGLHATLHARRGVAARPRQCHGCAKG